MHQTALYYFIIQFQCHLVQVTSACFVDNLIWTVHMHIKYMSVSLSIFVTTFLCSTIGIVYEGPSQVLCKFPKCQNNWHLHVWELIIWSEWPKFWYSFRPMLALFQALNLAAMHFKQIIKNLIFSNISSCVN